MFKIYQFNHYKTQDLYIRNYISQEFCLPVQQQISHIKNQLIVERMSTKTNVRNLIKSNSVTFFNL